MSLYPTTVLDVITAAENPNPIQPGNLIVIPIDMTSTVMTTIDLQQMSNTQDFSMRAWLSIYPSGAALPSDDNPAGIYPVIKFSQYNIVVYQNGQTPAESTFPINVLPGMYFLNILNLTNELNYFGFTKTDSLWMEC